jgi:hypothetical protein
METKAEGLRRSSRLEDRLSNIRVNRVCSGHVDTT